MLFAQPALFGCCSAMKQILQRQDKSNPKVEYPAIQKGLWIRQVATPRTWKRQISVTPKTCWFAQDTSRGNLPLAATQDRSTDGYWQDSQLSMSPHCQIVHA